MNICKSCVLMKITKQSTGVYLMLLFCNYLTMFGNISINHCFLRWFGNLAFKAKSVIYVFSLRKCSYWIFVTLSGVIKDGKQFCVVQMSLKPSKASEKWDD